MDTLNPSRLLVTSALCAFACSAGSAPSSGIDRGVAGAGTDSGGAPGSSGAQGSGLSQAGAFQLIDAGTGAVGGKPGPTDRDAACAAEARDSKPIVNDLFMMIDRSVSMNCGAADTNCDNPGKNVVQPTRWKAVTDALNGFLQAPTSTGFGVGVGFFELPGADYCNVAAYAKPVAPIALLPASAATVSGAIAMTSPGGTTPTEPALQGAIDYAKSYTLATPGHTAAVVFVTDGLPHGCNSSIAGAATIAQNGLLGSPPIKTYVVGLGATAGLDAIALAGSAGQQHYFPAMGDVTAQLTAALKQITKQKIGCDYTIPTAGKSLDYGAVNVQVTVGATGTPSFVGKIDSAANCSALGGWYYDVNPPAAPSKLTLCPQSCDPLTMNDGSKLQVLIGCASEPPK